MRDATHLFGDPRLPDRFWSKIDIAPCGCWLWTASLTRDSYPERFRTGGAKAPKVSPARLAYVTFVGPVPDGHQIGHQCHSLNLDTCAGGDSCSHRRCVNPLDVEPETPRQNVLGGHTFQRRNSQVTHCPARHWYTPENTRMNGPKRSLRSCKKCERNRGRVRNSRPLSEMEGPDF